MTYNISPYSQPIPVLQWDEILGEGGKAGEGDGRGGEGTGNAVYHPKSYFRIFIIFVS